MKEDTRIPRLFQKCKTGSAVKDVEAAAFPWEAANLEVEYGLVSPGAEHELHSSLMGHFLHTSFRGSTAEPLRKSQLKKFCPELSSRFAPSLHSEFYRLLNKDEWISYVAGGISVSWKEENSSTTINSNGINQSLMCHNESLQKFVISCGMKKLKLFENNSVNLFYIYFFNL